MEHGSQSIFGDMGGVCETGVGVGGRAEVRMKVT